LTQADLREAREIGVGRVDRQTVLDGQGHQGSDAGDAVADGGMPPARYVLVHPDARLSGAERQLLTDALAAMRAGGDGNSGPGGDD